MGGSCRPSTQEAETGGSLSSRPACATKTLLRRKEKRGTETGKEDGRRGLGGGESRGKGEEERVERKGRRKRIVTEQISAHVFSQLG